MNLTINDILIGITLLSTAFAVWQYFTKPQVDLDKREAINQKQQDGDTKLLAYQVTNDREATDRRFLEMSARLVDSTTLAQNHIHTVDTKVDTLRVDFNAGILALTKEVATLTAIINERIPGKK